MTPQVEVQPSHAFRVMASTPGVSAIDFVRRFITLGWQPLTEETSVMLRREGDASTRGVCNLESM